MLHSVIMAGGSGTRFWPLSRKGLPKQFLPISSEKSLIYQAFERCQPLIPAERTWVVTGRHLADLTREHLPTVPAGQILQEPAARNTAPCIGIAALCLLDQDRDATMLTMPADHVIDDAAKFQSDVLLAAEVVNRDPEQLVLFGVPPTYPATGFGYIERGESNQGGAFDVKAFREKPDRATAETYLRAGTFFWNCGIFVWRADRILQAIATHEPELARGLESLRPYLRKPGWDDALAEIFPTLKSISIDYAVLEREQKISVLEASFPWDDVGGWEAVLRMVSPDAQGNSVVGQGVVVESENCLVHTSDDHLVALLGIENCIVVRTPDATLVAKRGDEEAIRKVIAKLQCPDLENYL